jgi:hypothetical protein
MKMPGQEISAAPREVWDRSLVVEATEWRTLAWQDMPAAWRRGEWERHLRDLGLSMSEFTDEDVLMWMHHIWLTARRR